ncbi:MAG: alpha/beta hydrolase family esterase, partial [Candidatus Binatia bacterium]
MGHGVWGRRFAGMAVALLLASATPAAAVFTTGLNARSMSFDSQTRQYDVYVPASYDGSSAVPLVVDFHGAGSNKTQERSVSGFQALANSEGYIVAYPQGLFNTFNAGFCCGGAVSNNIDDVGFARALVDQIAAEANIDRRRVYSTGLSNGGFMTHRLACEAADVFAAFAPTAAFIGVSPCTPSRPLALMMFMGLNDMTVPYGTAAPSFLSWRNNAQCVGVTPDETVIDGGSNCQTYTNCADGVEVGLCSVNSGHVVYINPDIVVAATAWDFMSRFSLPAALDSYKCYKATDLKAPKFLGTTRTLSDEFGVNDGSFEATKP